jgi:hypothetical protein
MITDKGLTLVHLDGTEVKLGEVVTDFWGDTSIVQGGIAPRNPESTGRVQTDDGLYYPGVYNLKWVKL